MLENNKDSLSYSSHFLGGFLFGIGFFSIYLFWIREPFFLDESSKNYAFFSYLLIFYCSIYFGLIFCIIKVFDKVTYKVIMLPSLIVVSEFICAKLLYGFPWFSFALINSNNLFGTTLVFYLGTLGLSYITIFTFLFPYIFLFKNIKIKYIFLLNYSLIFIVIFLLIFFKILSHNVNMTNSMSILIAQLNYPPTQYLNLEDKITKLKKINKIITDSNTEIIIFAENDFPFLMDARYLDLLQDKLKKKQKLIIGSIRKESSNYYNSLFFITKNDYQKYDKQILVPFGEFIPFRHYLKFMEYIAGTIDFTKGSDDRMIFLENNFNILPVICYEIIYYLNLIKDNNTNIIINITNDSWFGDFLGPYQHFYFTKLRAAEFNKPIIRVSSNGISGLIDNNGVIKNYIKLNNNELKKFNISKIDIGANYLFFHKIIFLLIFVSIFLVLFLNKKK